MPRRSTWYRNAPTTVQLENLLQSFEAVAPPTRVRRARLFRGAVRWDFESDAEFVTCYADDVDDAILALDSHAGSLRVTVRSKEPRTRIVVRLQSVDLVNSVYAVVGQDPAPSAATDAAIFIGHGRNPAWRELAEHLRDHHGFNVITYESAVRAGVPNRTVLKELARQADIAFLVHSVDDMDDDGSGRTSENVVHETGLFQGLLGTRRAVVLREDGCRSFANIEGLNEIRFSRGRIVETFGEVVAVIRRELASR